MSRELKRFLKFDILFIGCLFLFTHNIFAMENIKTINITMNTLTDNYSNSILSDKEIEQLITTSTDKSFEEISDININHTGRDITIKVLIDENKGNVDSLINTGIFNYFYLTKDFNLYNTNFEIEVRFENANGRMMKQHMYSYTFNKETLQKIDWENIDYKDFTKNADKYWTITEGEQENDKLAEDSFQLKIINILKDYVSYKLNNLEQNESNYDNQKKP